MSCLLARPQRAAGSIASGPTSRGTSRWESASSPSSSAPTLAGNTLTWTQTGAGMPDLALASITVGAVDRQFTHSIAAPYSGMSLRIPALLLLSILVVNSLFDLVA